MEPTGLALAKATNGLVILVDYKNISSCSYGRSVDEIVPSIGSYLAQVITKLEVDTDKIELIGHSLGAHIAGYAGATLNGTIRMITGKQVQWKFFIFCCLFIHDFWRSDEDSNCMVFFAIIHQFIKKDWIQQDPVLIRPIMD